MGAKYLRNITKILKSASGVLYGRATAGTGRGEELTPAQVRTLISFDESVDDRVSALLAAGTNITITYNDAANTLTIASTAGGLSGTGSVDNAALRADGTGGATLQNSSIIINDNLTATPNNTVNHACIEATGGTTDVSVSIKPKGAGAFCLSAPDGTATGGNVRGSNSIDLQTSRTSASQVASGSPSILAGRRGTASGSESICLSASDSTASGTKSVAIGDFANATNYGATAIGINAAASGNQAIAMQGGTASGSKAISIGAGTASGTESIQIGNGGVSSGFYTVCIGKSASANYYYGVAIGHITTANNNSVSIGSEGCSATGDSTIAIAPGGASVTGHCAIGLGRGVRATRIGEFARSTGSTFSAAYDRLEVGFQLSCTTTDATPTNMLLRYYSGTSRLTLASGRLLVGILQVTGQKSDGSAVAIYTRRVALKNVGGTTTLVQSLTMETDYEDNASTDIAITADDTNDALQVAVTGITGETWRWFGLFYPAVEFAYGT